MEIKNKFQRFQLWHERTTLHSIPNKTSEQPRSNLDNCESPFALHLYLIISVRLQSKINEHLWWYKIVDRTTETNDWRTYGIVSITAKFSRANVCLLNAIIFSAYQTKKKTREATLFGNKKQRTSFGKFIYRAQC